MQDKPEGKLTDMWAAELTKSELQTVDVASGVAAVLSVKDEDEIKHTKKAGYMAARVMKDFTVAELEGEVSQCAARDMRNNLQNRKLYSCPCGEG